MPALLSIAFCYILTLACVVGGLLSKGKCRHVRILPTAWRLFVVTCLFTVPLALFGSHPLLIFAGYLGCIVILSGFPLNLFPPLLNWAIILEDADPATRANAAQRPS